MDGSTSQAGALMWSLDSAIRRGDPALLSISGSGTVSVYPRQRCYVSDIKDWDHVYAAPASQICVALTAWTAPPPDALPLEQLQWRAALHMVQSEAGAAGEHTLLQLQSWPNLTRLPEDLIEPVTRICALLWRKPTVSYLVARVLELPAESTAQILRVLQMFGHVTGVGGVRREGQAGDAARPEQAAQAADAAGLSGSATPPQPNSIVSKLWRKLLRSDAS